MVGRGGGGHFDVFEFFLERGFSERKVFLQRHLASSVATAGADDSIE